jgi:DivIVA domain-containing protein
VALLTADDIRYRKFAATRFREGYDVDEVDDFLEEVIHTVDELTRIAQGAAATTGSFSAVQPVVDINSNPVVANLRSENSALNNKVADLQKRLEDASKGQGGGLNDQQLLDDNKLLAEQIRAAKDDVARLTNDLNTKDSEIQAANARVAELEGKVREAEERARNAAANSSAPAPVPSLDGSDALRKANKLQDDLNRLQADYVEVVNRNKSLDDEIQKLKESAGDSADAQQLQSKLDEVRKQLDESNQHVSRLQVKLQEADSQGPNTGSMQAIGEAASAAANGTSQAAAMLSMAQQLHDEYVQKGKSTAKSLVEDAQTEHDQLLATAKAEHDRMIKEGNEERDKTLADAKAKADETYAELAKERSGIEKKIAELRMFERDYRTRLKTFLKTLLEDVEVKTTDKSE